MGCHSVSKRDRTSLAWRAALVFNVHQRYRLGVRWHTSGEAPPSASALAKAEVATRTSDPLFLEHDATLFGWVRRAPAITESTWEQLRPLLDYPETYPYGTTLTGVYLEKR